MKTILNFFKGLFFNSDSDMIGLATIKVKKTAAVRPHPQEKREHTLTEMLRRSY